ncbi:MAG: hypothetical protein JRG90_16525 [Deltaproteobacteria bacterium]|nr:hypothetical protein [Deltaproteobacteria bacterium]
MTMEDEKNSRKTALARLEDYAIEILYSFIERPAEDWRFWAKITGVMVIALVGPMIAISLFFLGRDLGYFN